MNQPLFEVEAIEKEFESVKAVDRLSFHVQAGEIFALLGPNGAGKNHGGAHAVAHSASRSRRDMLFSHRNRQ